MTKSLPGAVIEYEKSCGNFVKDLEIGNAEQELVDAEKNIETYLFIRRCKQIQDGIGDTE